jgi:hypothetical protein
MNSLRSAWTAVLAGLPDAMISAKASCQETCPGNGHYHEKRYLHKIADTTGSTALYLDTLLAVVALVGIV